MTSPDREPQPQLITADAAMLAAQNERIDRLVGSIEQLTEAVKHRPTKFDLEQTRKRLRNQLVATVIVAAVLFGAVGMVLYDLHDQCVNRNSNTQAFRSLLVYLVGATEDAATDSALETYLNTLEPVDCL